MSKIYVLISDNPSTILKDMLESTIKDNDVVYIKSEKELINLQNKRILFVAETDESGYSIGMNKIFNKLFSIGKDSLKGSIGSVLVHSEGELYTKTMAQHIIFNANQLGCRFPGRPLVEATGSLNNMKTMKKVINKSLKDVCLICCEKLGKTLVTDNPQLIKKPKILALHSSNYSTSNTLRLWAMVKQHLKDADVKEIHIENGTVRDCIGCPYKTCKHYGEQTSCFYGGIMVEEIYPAIIEADVIVWICPNYNDAISANISAVINRLTALFRKTKFYDKSIFGIIVSGNSGSDALAKQLISSLNINKTFRLPPYFSIMATANDKDAILKVPDIEKKAHNFAKNILEESKK